MIRITCFVFALLLVAGSVHAQQAIAAQSLDDWDDIFVETVDDANDAATTVPIDDAERPQPPQINLPGEMEEVPIWQGQSLSPELQAWTRWLVLQNLPPTYENNKKWGKTKEVYDGFRFRREGLKVETYRKWKTVKQGTWSRYYIEFDDPQQKLELSIDNVRSVGDGKVAFQITVIAPLHVFGRVARWQRDIQLISISMNADATVQLVADCECAVRFNPLVFPPDIIFQPRVTAAHAELKAFEVHRISQIGGAPAEQLGKGMRMLLEKKLEDYDAKLVEKINRALEKQKDKLHIHTQDKLSDQLKKMWQLD